MKTAAIPPSPPTIDVSFVDELVARLGDRQESLVPLLQAIQEHWNYLPATALQRLCDISRITPAALAGVATFYPQFRHSPAGRHLVRVCHGTACHVQGAERVEETLRRELHLRPHQDTDDAGEFTIERVGCLGCCTLAPVIHIDHQTYGHVEPKTVAQALADARSGATASRHEGESHAAGSMPRATNPPLPVEIRVGVGSCCVAGGSMDVRHAIEQAATKLGVRVVVKPVGCVGMCHQTPLVEVVQPDRPSSLYAKVNEDQVEDILRGHFPPIGLRRTLARVARRWMDRLVNGEPRGASSAACRVDPRDPPVHDFLSRQRHIATECRGQTNPLDLEEYVSREGFVALRHVLEKNDPEGIIAQIKDSGLRGRGGGGFPTGLKWERTRDATGQPKFVICNGDEGDPGAFMDRMILESYPYRVIEGMTIAAFAVGAREGVFYIRREYPLAVRRVREAIARCRETGRLGDHLFGSGFSFNVRVVEGAGAFVCGEETALIASLEGRRGMPRLRPPFPAETGLHGQPTCVNNVETLAMVPWILRHGPEAFAGIGTASSKGTKVFALAGKVARGGLIEVPLGITLREIVEEIGGGVTPGRRFKAVQVGGPSGGCIPAELADTPVDFESLQRLGAIMGSGGMVVLDDRDCIVDLARYFLSFTQAESCGKCTFCRVGTQRMMEILTRLCDGAARPDELDELETLGRQVQRGSLCGLGQTAPNPVLSTLRFFRGEYEAHLRGQCPAGRCKPLIRYEVNERCIGCTLCAQHCPVDAIPFTPYREHAIDTEKCTRCDVCRQVCPEDAIDVLTPVRASKGSA